MNVSNLIKVLQTLPPEMEVFVPTLQPQEEGDYVELYRVKTTELTFATISPDEDNDDEDKETRTVCVLEEN